MVGGGTVVAGVLVGPPPFTVDKQTGLQIKRKFVWNPQLHQFDRQELTNYCKQPNFKYKIHHI